MTPVNQITIIQNSDVDFQVRVVDSACGDPVDLTPYTLAASGDIHAIFIDSCCNRVVKTLSASGGVTTVNVGGGKMNIHLTAVDTAGLKSGDPQSFEIELVKGASGSLQAVQVIQFIDSLTVLPRVSC